MKSKPFVIIIKDARTIEILWKSIVIIFICRPAQLIVLSSFFFPNFILCLLFGWKRTKKKEKIRKSLRTYSRNRIPHLGSDSLLLPGGGSGGFRAQRQQGRNRQQQQEQNNNNNNKKSNLLEEAAAQENTPWKCNICYIENDRRRREREQSAGL